uniref:Uncharacterized protein n=1 Tax=Anguilla anguilla TaxID=7936 RepID=A0A0E9STQ2_ANGAN
MRDVTELAD